MCWPEAALESLPEPCDALVVTAPESLIYFANFAPSPFVFNTVNRPRPLDPVPDRSILFADNLLRPFLDRSQRRRGGRLDWYTGKQSAPSPRLQLAARLPDSFPSRPGTVSVSNRSVPA